MAVAPRPYLFHLTHPRRVYRRLTAFVDSRSLGLGDALKLALAPQVRLEFREDAQHSRKHLPAAVLVSIGCSVAFIDAPRALMARCYVALPGLGAGRQLIPR
jgi:hypothetical protein